MKFIFFVLLSLNVVFFLWEYSESRPSNLNNDETIRQMQDPTIDRIILLAESTEDRLSAGPVITRGEPNVPIQISNRDDPQIFAAVNQPLSKSIAQYSESLVSDLLESASARQIYRQDPIAGDDFEFTTDWSWQDKIMDSCCPPEKLPAELIFPPSPVPTEAPSEELVTTDVEEVADTAGNAGLDNQEESNDRKNTDSIAISDGLRDSTVEPERFCYKLGPRFSKKSFLLIAAKFKQAGLASTIKSETVDKETGFIVYYPAARSFEASKANVKALKAKGLRDLWLINKGEMRGNISLGIFKSRKRAEIMQQEMKAEEIYSRIKPKLSKRTGYFLVFDSALAAEKLDDRLAESGFEGKEMVTIDRANCEN